MVDGTHAPTLDDAHEIRALGATKGWALLAKRLRAEIQRADTRLRAVPSFETGEPLKEWQVVKLQEHIATLEWILSRPEREPEDVLAWLEGE